jgi:hypothetical protein
VDTERRPLEIGGTVDITSTRVFDLRLCQLCEVLDRFGSFTKNNLRMTKNHLSDSFHAKIINSLSSASENWVGKNIALDGDTWLVGVYLTDLHFEMTTLVDGRKNYEDR